MIILNRNVTCEGRQWFAGQDVDGVLSENAIDDLLKRGWAHSTDKKETAQEEAEQSTETDAQDEAVDVDEETIDLDEELEEDQEDEDVVIDSLADLPNAGRTGRKGGK